MVLAVVPAVHVAGCCQPLSDLPLSYSSDPQPVEGTTVFAIRPGTALKGIGLRGLAPEEAAWFFSCTGFMVQTVSKCICPEREQIRSIAMQKSQKNKTKMQKSTTSQGSQKQSIS